MAGKIVSSILLVFVVLLSLIIFVPLFSNHFYSPQPFTIEGVKSRSLTHTFNQSDLLAKILNEYGTYQIQLMQASDSEIRYSDHDGDAYIYNVINNKITPTSDKYYKYAIEQDDGKATIKEFNVHDTYIDNAEVATSSGFTRNSLRVGCTGNPPLNYDEKGIKWDRCKYVTQGDTTVEIWKGEKWNILVIRKQNKEYVDNSERFIKDAMISEDGNTIAVIASITHLRAMNYFPLDVYILQLP